MIDWLVPAIIGWCGTGWPFPFPRGGGTGGGGGGFDPDNPWPPNCPMCGGVIGAISAIVINSLVGEHFASAGFLGMVLISFAAGSVGNSLVGGIVGLFRRG
jgi:hypothetical protein